MKGVTSVLVSALLIAGCGGSDESDAPARAPGDQPGAAKQADDAAKSSKADSDGDGVYDLYDEDPLDAAKPGGQGAP